MEPGDIIQITLALAAIFALAALVKRLLGDNPYTGTGCGGG